MQSIPRLVIVAATFAVVLGLPFGLYWLLTRGQRRTMHQIRTGARRQGWRFRLRHWQGNPTAFRIDGRTRAALPWVLTSEDSGGYDRGWSVRLHQRFPALGGQVDLAILPRTPEEPGNRLPASPVPAGIESRIAAFSGSTAASAIGFLGHAREAPTGLAAFDAALAERILNWPTDSTAPRSVLAWRDPFGFHFEARFPAQPNWAAVSYLL